MMTYSVSMLPDSLEMYRKEFHNFSFVPQTGCQMGHTGLTIDHRDLK